MKKLLLFMAAATVSVAAGAKVWRVNYDENAKADFKTIAEACATTLVTDGDTLYMEPGLHSGSSTDNTISRPLTILGPGWGFEANEGAISSMSTATFTSSIYIRSSNDVSVIGVVSLGEITTSGNLNRHNIRIEHCKAGTIYISAYPYTMSNVTIRDNICSARLYLYCDELLSTIIIENNLVTGSGGVDVGASDYNGNRIFIRHNTIFGSVSQGAYRTVYDNIIFASSPISFGTTYENYQFYNNVLAISQERYDADQTSVSPVGYSNYADNIFAGATFANTCTDQIEGIYFDDAMRYQVREDSPAKGAATDGTDCGAFGGEHPFVLYGRPDGIPYIYDVEVPAYPTNNQLTISFKVAGQNE